MKLLILRQSSPAYIINSKVVIFANATKHIFLGYYVCGGRGGGA
jgi:hypothetical protein